MIHEIQVNVELPQTENQMISLTFRFDTVKSENQTKLAFALGFEVAKPARRIEHISAGHTPDESSATDTRLTTSGTGDHMESNYRRTRSKRRCVLTLNHKTTT